MNNLVSIIILNYNNYDFTIDCLKSLQKQIYKNFEVIIIDNGSKYDLYFELSKRIKNFENSLKIRLIRSNINLYFTAGNNKAIKIAKGKYICLLNYDTVVEPDFIKKMVDFLDKHKDAGMISPKIKVYNSKDFLWYAGGEINLKKTPIEKIRGKWESDPMNQKYNDISLTSFAVGTALFMKKEIVDKIGLLDDIFFMYHEDVDWNFRAKKYKINNYYVPTTIVYHKVSRIAHPRKVIFVKYLNRRNTQIIIWKHANLMTLAIFYFHFGYLCLKSISKELRKKKLYLVYLELNGIYHGIKIGIKKRIYKSCRKNLVKNFHFIKRNQKKIQSLKI